MTLLFRQASFSGKKIAGFSECLIAQALLLRLALSCFICLPGYLTRGFVFYSEKGALYASINSRRI